MKKGIFTLFSALLFSFSLSAQTVDTIDAAHSVKGGTPIGTDILYSVDLSSANVPSFAADTNHTWLLSNVQFTDSAAVKRWGGAPSPFQYADSLGFQFDSLHYYARGLSFFSVQGRSTYKQEIDTQTYTITKLSGAKDTIAFPSYENVIYTAPYNAMVYPLTYGTTWASDYSYTTSFNVTDAAMHYNHSYSTRKTHYTETDTVIGWGKMHIITTDVDTIMEVLQTKIIKMSTDTFHLPNVNLFDSLSLQPNYMSATYEQDFFYKGHVAPFVRVVFTDGSFTTVQSIWVNMDFEMTPGVSVNNVSSNTADIRIYPNPVVNGKLYVEVPGAANGQWSYQLVNIAGQTISANTLLLGAGQQHASINVPANQPAGVYYIRLFNNGQAVGVKAVEIK